jgi:hypothetical protein
VGVEKLAFSEKRPELGVRKCLGNQRKSFIGILTRESISAVNAGHSGFLAAVVKGHLLVAINARTLNSNLR